MIALGVILVTLACIASGLFLAACAHINTINDGLDDLADGAGDTYPASHLKRNGRL